MNFYNRLYLGFEGEYFVVSRLFAAGFEAFKLPGDFGFDLIVGNIRERTFGKSLEEANARFPHVIQVKSRRLHPSRFTPGPNGRPEADVVFTVSERDWTRLIQEERASLVSVVFYRHPGSDHPSTATAFWLPSTALNTLRARCYFRTNSSGGHEHYEYLARIRLMPTQDRDSVLDAMVEDGDLTERGRTQLQQQLPEALPLGWKASPYLSLLRRDRSDPRESVARGLPDQLTDLGLVGTHVPVSDVLD